MVFKKDDKESSPTRSGISGLVIWQKSAS